MAADESYAAGTAERDVLSSLPDAIVCIRNDGIITGAWGACAEVFGDSADDLVGLDGFSRVHPDDLAFAAGALFEAMGRDGEHIPVNLRIRSVYGPWVLVEASAGLGHLLGDDVLLLSLRPLAYRGHMDERRADLQQRCLRIAATLASAHASQLQHALNDAVASINEFFFTAATRFCAPRAVCIDVGDLVQWPEESDIDVDGFVDHGRVGNHNIFEIAFPADGPARWFLAWNETDPGMAGWDGSHLENVRLAGSVAASASARLVLEADLSRRARLDPLTGLDNRGELQDKLERMLQDGPVTVLFCDLDGFKQANDQHGHAFGDIVLAEAANRMSYALRTTDVLGRVGGDEFVAACPFMEAEDAIAVVERLETALRAPIVVDGSEVTVGVSVGSATAPRGSSAEALIAAADAAMYAVKASRKPAG
jgi:diguanylate cyclase (GGDEF)-like protein